MIENQLCLLEKMKNYDENFINGSMLYVPQMPYNTESRNAFDISICVMGESPRQMAPFTNMV